MRPSTDRDPVPPPRDLLREVSGRVLDPGTALSVKGVIPRPTAYVGPRLICGAHRDRDEVLRLLNEAAEPLGWTVAIDPDFPESRALGREGERPIGVSRFLISVWAKGATT